MLRVRVVSPPGSTERLVDRRSVDPGIRNLMVLPGAARRPAGDVVQFDLLTRFANPVLRELRALPFGERGSVVVEDTGVADSTDADPGGKAHFGEVAPVWELVESKIRAGGSYP